MLLGRAGAYQPPARRPAELTTARPTGARSSTCSSPHRRPLRRPVDDVGRPTRGRSGAGAASRRPRGLRAVVDKAGVWGCRGPSGPPCAGDSTGAAAARPGRRRCSIARRRSARAAAAGLTPPPTLRERSRARRLRRRRRRGDDRGVAIERYAAAPTPTGGTDPIKSLGLGAPTRDDLAAAASAFADGELSSRSQAADSRGRARRARSAAAPHHRRRGAAADPARRRPGPSRVRGRPGRRRRSRMPANRDPVATGPRRVPTTAAARGPALHSPPHCAGRRPTTPRRRAKETRLGLDGHRATTIERDPVRRFGRRLLQPRAESILDRRASTRS